MESPWWFGQLPPKDGLAGNVNSGSAISNPTRLPKHEDIAHRVAGAM